MRYEDFTLNMINKAKQLFDFMNLDFQPVSRNFIFKATHPNTTEGGFPIEIETQMCYLITYYT